MSTMLFEDGPWRICRTGLRDNTAIYHQCGDPYNVDNTWWHISAEDTCLYCKTKVPDPILGLIELHRVSKPGGRLILLEHMRPGNPILGLVFDVLNPLVVRMMGANINRRTVDNIRSAGWNIEVEKKLSGDVVRWIEARP